MYCASLVILGFYFSFRCLPFHYNYSILCQLLHCSYHNPQVLPVFPHSPPQSLGGGVVLCEQGLLLNHGNLKKTHVLDKNTVFYNTVQGPQECCLSLHHIFVSKHTGDNTTEPASLMGETMVTLQHLHTVRSAD